MTQNAEPVQSGKPSPDVLNVLVVDDNDFNRDIATEHMEGEGHKVISFENARKALEYLTANPQAIDILLVDYMMPGMTGLEFLQKLRADPRFTSLPAIMVSAHPDKDALLTAHASCGIAGWVTKPFEREELLTMLGKVTGRCDQAHS